MEAGFAGPYTPQEFIQAFGVLEPERSNGRSAETAAAWATVEAEQARFERAHAEVGELIGRLRRQRGESDPEGEEALTLAAEERARAGDAVTAARIHYHEAAKVDELRHAREEYDAGLQAMAREREEREQARGARGAGVLARLRKGRS